MERLQGAYQTGNSAAKGILESYAKGEFFTDQPDVEDEIKVVTYIAAEGDISTDLLSPGNQAHSRADRELHGKSFISEKSAGRDWHMQEQNPDKRVMLIAEKGTMGVEAPPGCRGLITRLYGRQTSKPLCTLCELRTYCRGDKWHFTDIYDHGGRYRGDRY